MVQLSKYRSMAGGGKVEEKRKFMQFLGYKYFFC